MSSLPSGSTSSFGGSSSQPARFPQALDSASAPPDGRTPGELAAFARTFAKGLRFWHTDGRDDPSGFWLKIFPEVQSIVQAEKLAAASPDKALFITFLQLYLEAQRELNCATARHLEFYYREVLGLIQRGAKPDRSHLILALKKTATELPIPAGTVFSTKSGLRYASEFDIVANRAALGLRRILARDSSNGRLHFAAEAASADGLGEELPAENPSWHPFGHGHPLPIARLGLALSSPILLLREGERTITATFVLTNDTDTLTSESLIASLTGEMSGEKSWLQAGAPTEVKLGKSTAGLTEIAIAFSLNAKAGAVVAYDPTVLDGGFDTVAPILKVSLSENATDAVAAALSAAEIDSVRLNVEVTGMKDLILENDFGRLDAAKAFLPFGPTPRVGSSFYINAEEALTKDVTSVKLHLNWNGVPASFKSYYTGYPGAVSSNANFTADLEILRDGKFQPLLTNTRLFEDDATLQRTIDSTKSEAPLLTFGGVAYVEFARQFSRHVPTAKIQMPFSTVSVVQPLRSLKAPSVIAFRERIALPLKFDFTRLRPFSQRGFLRLQLKKDFQHSRYAELFANAVSLNQTEAGKKDPKPVPNLPYTPELASFTLNYTARSPECRPGSGDAGAFASRDVRLYHLTPFGQREEHRFIKEQVGAESLTVSMLPRISNDGELYLGLTNIGARESVSLLFQFLEGSANPLSTRQSIKWSALCANHWKPLKPEEILAEQTEDFLVSGVVRLLLPPTLSTNNTLLDPGFAWLRAAVKGDVTGVCRLLAVHPNAVPVTLTNPEQAAHLETSLPPGTITVAPPSLRGLKEVGQPYGTFGGAAPESGRAFHTRTSERLRHRRRAVNAWDYERLVLDAFPKIHRVMCLTHTNREVHPAPGSVTLVVIADTRGLNQANPLTPFVDLATLTAIEEFLADVTPPFVQVAAINPLFEPLQLRFKVAFKPGKPFASFRPILDEDIKRHLSPWAFDGSKLPDFGGSVQRSSLLAFIESLDYVDYLTELALVPAKAQGDPVKLQQVHPTTPASIITSAAGHDISPEE
jgi:hypothetical protein